MGTQTNNNRRRAIRLTSFSLAAAAVCGFGWYKNYHQSQYYQNALEMSYMRAIEDLASYMNDLNGTLAKSMYSGTPEQLSRLSADIWRDAGYAKNSLSQIPTGFVQLEKTYKYLSQVGDYAKSMARKVSSGQTLSEEERRNMQKLSEYGKALEEQLFVLQDEIMVGNVSYEEVEDTLSNQQLDPNQSQTVNVGDGFKDFEDGIDGYPTLIYDGPFSDHILEKEPEFLKGQPEISREEARKRAAAILGTEEANVQDDSDEDGKMPSYGFYAEDSVISVTKAGGFICYTLSSRPVSEDRIQMEQACQMAEKYLKDIGYDHMQTTYYEKNNNVLTVNFAAKEGEVTCYNGEILGMDARGYLTNHKSRSLPAPSISEEDARNTCSPLLEVQEVKLALIPSAGQNEIYCYELNCLSETGDHVLVYINAETGAEEQILILLINENGTLTI